MYSSACGLCLVAAFALLSRSSGQIDPGSAAASRCISGSSTWYLGTINVTKTGIPCQRWDSNVPHTTKRTPRDGGNHSYCRNPDNDPLGTWCYTTNVSVRWEHCNISKCQDDSLLLMTSRKTPNQTWIFQFPADPELSVDTITSPTAVVSSVGNNYIWTVAADKRGQRAFFADFREDYLGTYSFQTNTTTKKLLGQMAGIEELAYDWVTGNLYWADSYKNWIMASDRRLERTVIVYKNSSELMYGVALHAKLRLLFFSSKTSTRQSTIRVTNLAGQGFSEIYSSTNDIRSIAVDYTDDRLYWGMNLVGRRAQIMSCFVNGSDVKIHTTLTRTTTWGIAAYLNTIYIADQTDYYNFRRGFYFKLKLVPKDRGLARVISYPVKLKGLSIYSTNEEFSIDTVPSAQSCSSLPACDHICLPTDSARICKCALGYVKSGDTSCIARPLQDNYMVVADVPQNRIYQISLVEGQPSYAVLPIDTAPTIGAMTLNVVSKTLYWFDRSRTCVYSSASNGTNVSNITCGKHVKSMATDHVTGNVYFADDDSEYIFVMDKRGRYVKTLMKPSGEKKNFSSIQAISLDITNKFVYWIDFNGTTGTGELWRMLFDGSNQEMVFGGLEEPRAMFIDDTRASMFLSVGSAALSTGKVYEIKKDFLNSTTGALLSQAIRYNVPGLPNNAKIVEIYEEDSILYFASDPYRGLKRVNLTERVLSASSLENDFFKPRFFSIYRDAPSRRLFIDDLLNACDNSSSTCSQLCLMTSQTNRVCACQDGVNATGTQCGNTPVTVDLPPTYGSSCPGDSAMTLDPCQDGVNFVPVAPQWTDDNTDPGDLVLGQPIVQSSYSAGVHTFSYTATDESRNVGHCSYTLTVTRRICTDLIDSTSIHTITVGTPECRNGEQGSQISCANSVLNIAYGDFVNKSLWNPCSSRTYRYQIPDLNHVTCVSATPPTTKPQVTTSSVTLAASGPITTKAVQKPQPSTGGLSGGATAAVVIVVLVAVAVAGVLLFLKFRKRGSRFFPRTTDGDTNPMFSWEKGGQSSYQKF